MHCTYKCRQLGVFWTLGLKCLRGRCTKSFRALSAMQRSQAPGCFARSHWKYTLQAAHSAALKQARLAHHRLLLGPQSRIQKPQVGSTKVNGIVFTFFLTLRPHVQ